jgi:hypothetical protein
VKGKENMEGRKEETKEKKELYTEGGNRCWKRDCCKGPSCLKDVICRFITRSEVSTVLNSLICFGKDLKHKSDLVFSS